MRQHWDNLQPRERHVLAGGLIALVFLLIYALAIDPFIKEMQSLRTRVASQRQDLAWMQQAAAEVKRLSGQRPAAASSGQSLLTVVDSTARSSGLADSLNRVQPDGQSTVRVWLQEATFDQVISWLDTLKQKHGVRVASVVVERQESAGRVNASLVLEGAP